MIVRSILVEMTSPFRIAPRMVTSEVNGHFLSTYLPLMAAAGVLMPRPMLGCPDQCWRTSAGWPSCPRGGPCGKRTYPASGKQLGSTVTLEILRNDREMSLADSIARKPFLNNIDVSTYLLLNASHNSSLRKGDY